MLASRSFSLLVAATAMITACRRGGDVPGDSTAAASALSSAAGSEATAGSADDYGPPDEVSAVRSAWHNESSGNDTVPQAIVVKDYGVVEVRDGGPNSPFFVLYQRDRSGRWQDQGLVTGQVGLCGLSTKIPDAIAREIVAHDKRLAANQRANPQAGCSGAI